MSWQPKGGRGRPPALPEAMRLEVAREFRARPTGSWREAQAIARAAGISESTLLRIVNGHRYSELHRDDRETLLQQGPGASSSDPR